MKLYSSYIKKKLSDDSVEELILIRDDWSFWAFCFNLLWFLYHKMWLESVLVLALNLLLAKILENGFFSQFDQWIILLAFYFIVAINANALLARHLSNNKKYEFIGYSFGKNKDDARLRFVQNYFQNNLTLA